MEEQKYYGFNGGFSRWLSSSSEYDCEINEFTEVTRETIILNAVTAFVFFMGFCFGVFIQFKYLII